jgi:TolA-binding protein
MAVLLAGVAPAQETKPAGPAFWEAVRIKLEQLKPKKPAKTEPSAGVAVGAADKEIQANGSAVGGVRGAKDPSEDLYWKGEAQKVEVSEAERAAFVQAYEAFAAGKLSEALQGFESFIQTFPRSVLLEDAQRAVEELKTGR